MNNTPENKVKPSQKEARFHDSHKMQKVNVCWEVMKQLYPVPRRLDTGEACGILIWKMEWK